MLPQKRKSGEKGRKPGGGVLRPNRVREEKSGVWLFMHNCLCRPPSYCFCRLHTHININHTFLFCPVQLNLMPPLGRLQAQFSVVCKQQLVNRTEANIKRQHERTEMHLPPRGLTVCLLPKMGLFLSKFISLSLAIIPSHHRHL